jgi:uncharacterized protein (DUF302 family)
MRTPLSIVESMTVSTGKKLLEDSMELSLNPCRILSANEFAPTEKSNFTQTVYTQIKTTNVSPRLG